MTETKASAAEHEKRLDQLQAETAAALYRGLDYRGELDPEAIDRVLSNHRAYCNELASELDSMSDRVADLEAQNERLRAKADRAFAAGIDAATGEPGE